ncbi:hypothetical protein D3C86_1425850 [compost metagenome]
MRKLHAEVIPALVRELVFLEVQRRRVAVGNRTNAASFAQRAAAQLFLRELVPRLCLDAINSLVVRVQIHAEPVQTLAEFKIKLGPAVVVLVQQQGFFRRGLGEQHGAVVQVELAAFARKPVLRFVLCVAVELVKVVPVALYASFLRNDRGLAGPAVSLGPLGILADEASAGCVTIERPDKMRKIVGPRLGERAQRAAGVVVAGEQRRRWDAQEP